MEKWPLAYKSSNISKTGKIVPRLLLITNRKSHTRFRSMRKSMTVDDIEGSLCTLFQNTCMFRSASRKFEFENRRSEC